LSIIAYLLATGILRVGKALSRILQAKAFRVASKIMRGPEQLTATVYPSE
jgi:hypothetical protein